MSIANQQIETGTLTAEEYALASREVFRQKLIAFSMVTPLLIFILFAFVAPIGTMLYRAFYNPVVAEMIPNTLKLLETWDGVGVPNEETQNQFSMDLRELAKSRRSGKLAETVNRAHPGASSVIKSSARKLSKFSAEELEADGAALLQGSHKKWGETDIWFAIRSVGNVYSDANYLKSLDLERNRDGSIQPREDTKIYIQLYLKTLKMALIITLCCLALGYPLSYFLANIRPKTANLLMIFVLLPFWTSLLVRTTAWIALLQTNGVVNSFLMGIGLRSEPIDMLYTEFSTIVAMTHILLPFMILPIYAVMRVMDKSFMRAAMSMGATPIRAFISVYLPNTLSGLSAGVLLVFIISVGYYITPALVGGTAGQMISNIIAFHMQQSNNWGLAAALGTFLLVLILTLYWIYDRVVGSSNIKLG